MRVLIEENADIEAKRNNGETPLHRAAENGNLEAVRMLLEVEGANIWVTRDDGMTPLQWTEQCILEGEKKGKKTKSESQREKEVEKNIQRRKIVGFLTDWEEEKEEIFCNAVSDGNVEEVRTLLNEGVNPKCENEEGKTPLQLTNEILDDKSRDAITKLLNEAIGGWECLVC